MNVVTSTAPKCATFIFLQGTMEETTNHKFSLISAVNLGLIRLLKIVLLFMTLKLIKA